MWRYVWCAHPSKPRVIQSEYVDAQGHLFDIHRISIDTFQDIRKDSWISVDHHGQPWMFLDIHANAWMFHEWAMQSADIHGIFSISSPYRANGLSKDTDETVRAIRSFGWEGVGFEKLNAEPMKHQDRCVSPPFFYEQQTCRSKVWFLTQLHKRDSCFWSFVSPNGLEMIFSFRPHKTQTTQNWETPRSQSQF